MILAPGHFERFGESEIERHITGQPYHISVPCFTGPGVPPALVSGYRIATEEARGLSVLAPRRARLDRAQPDAAALDVPICCPKGVVRRPDREPGVPTEYAGQLPSAYETLHPLITIAKKSAASAEGELPNAVHVYDVPNIEIRVGVVVL